MTNWCVAPNCENGYKPKKVKKKTLNGSEQTNDESTETKTKVSLFSFPLEEKQPELRKKWITALPRKIDGGKNFNPSEHARLCKLHFQESGFNQFQYLT